MSDYPIIIAFLIGIAVGCSIILYGIRFGFKLSAEIRRFKGDDSIEGSFLAVPSDPAEFDLIQKEMDAE